MARGDHSCRVSIHLLVAPFTDAVGGLDFEVLNRPPISYNALQCDLLDILR